MKSLHWAAVGCLCSWSIACHGQTPVSHATFQERVANLDWDSEQNELVATFCADRSAEFATRSRALRTTTDLTVGLAVAGLTVGAAAGVAPGADHGDNDTKNGVAYTGLIAGGVAAIASAVTWALAEHDDTVAVEMAKKAAAIHQVDFGGSFERFGNTLDVKDTPSDAKRKAEQAKYMSGVLRSSVSVTFGGEVAKNIEPNLKAVVTAADQVIAQVNAAAAPAAPAAPAVPVPPGPTPLQTSIDDLKTEITKADAAVRASLPARWCE